MSDDDGATAPTLPAGTPTAVRLGEPFPDPVTADPGRDATRWGAPAGDYATAPDGTSGWMPPAPVPAGLPAAVEPVTARVGWLLAGRAEPGPDAAA